MLLFFCHHNETLNREQKTSVHFYPLAHSYFVAYFTIQLLSNFVPHTHNKIKRRENLVALKKGGFMDGWIVE
jgi:hypothetical protein